MTEVMGLENLRPDDIDLIESYLLRRDRLKNANQLGADIAGRVRSRLNNGAPSLDPRQDAEPPEVFLQQVLTAYRATHTRR